jgi:hypothetical protein
VLVEIQDKDRLIVHRDVAEAVDRMLRGQAPRTEVRERRTAGEVVVTHPESQPALTSDERKGARPTERQLSIFPYAISRERLARAIASLDVPAQIINDPRYADIVLTLKSHARRLSDRLGQQLGRQPEIRALRSNTLKQMEGFLREFFGVASGDQQAAKREVEEAVLEVLETRRPVELSPQPKHIRRMQHLYAERSGLISESRGREPERRVVIYPRY